MAPPSQRSLSCVLVRRHRCHTNHVTLPPNPTPRRLLLLPPSLSPSPPLPLPLTPSLPSLPLSPPHITRRSLSQLCHVILRYSLTPRRSSRRPSFRSLRSALPISTPPPSHRIFRPSSLPKLLATPRLAFTHLLEKGQ
jgi:hypothetical protein